MDNRVYLSLAIPALNNTPGPDGLINTLQVFRKNPKLPLGNIDRLPRNQRDRFAEMEIIVAAQRLKLAQKFRLKHMNVFSIPPETDVLVRREKSKS